MQLYGTISELVSAVFRKNSQTVTLRPNQTTTYTAARDVQLPPEDANSSLVSETATQTLTNKTLTSPAITGGTLSPVSLTVADANLFIQDNVDNTKQVQFQASAITSGTTRTLTVPDANTTIVGTDTTQTLTNKTLTSPAISTPTGLVKNDVGLGNVDNTSDATKNAATATLTNKTISGATNTISNVSLTTGVTGTLPVANGGTGTTTSTGSGNVVLSTSPTLVTPALGTPSAIILTNATSVPVNQATGTLAIANGGTGQTGANAAFNVLAPSQTGNSGKYLGTDGTNASWSTVSGGLSAVLATSNVALAVNNTMYSCTSTGGFTITLPTIPAGGGVIGVMDGGETCSATNFIRIAPATGQSIDSYAANDTLTLDYLRANVILYAAAGATSWKVQYQVTTTVQDASATLSGIVNTSAQTFAGAKTFTGTTLTTTPAATHAYLNSVITAAADVTIAVIFDVERFDIGNQYSTANGRFTATNSGYYQVSYGLRVETGGTAPSVLFSVIQKNDATTPIALATNRQSALVASRSYHLSDAALVQLNAGETVRIVLTSSTQASTVEFGATGQSFFSVAYVGS